MNIDTKKLGQLVLAFSIKLNLKHALVTWLGGYLAAKLAAGLVEQHLKVAMTEDLCRLIATYAGLGGSMSDVMSFARGVLKDYKAPTQDEAPDEKPAPGGDQ